MSCMPRRVAALKAGAAPIGFTYRFVRSDGSMGWIEGTSALERDIDGRTVVQSAFLDVSDRQQKRYEQDIHRYSMVLCSVYDEIVEFDGENKTYRSLYSSGRTLADRTMPMEEALKFWTDHLPEPDDRLRLRAAIDECLADDGASLSPAPTEWRSKIGAAGTRAFCCECRSRPCCAAART